MRLEVKVIPKAKTNAVVSRNGNLVVRVTAPADQGKANHAVRRLIAEYLNVSLQRVQIVRGAMSRQKVIEVLDVRRDVA